MRAYELMVIHDSDLDDAQVQDALNTCARASKTLQPLLTLIFGGDENLRTRLTTKPRVTTQ